jgi:tetratricopeptide (TPR) repeat protein
VHGSEQAETAAVRLAYGEIAWTLGRYEDARAQFADALRIEETLRGREHPATAAALVGLARTDASTGARDDALARLDRVDAVAREGRIDDVVLVGALEVRAQVLAAVGRGSEADAAIDRALAVARRLGPQHPLQAFPLCARAESHLFAHQPSEALRSLEQARKVLGASLDPNDPRRQELAVVTGRALLASGERTRAIEVLARARASLQSCCPGHARLREAEAALAEANAGPPR